jgi:hypothetical protein
MEQCPTKEINNVNLNLKTKPSFFLQKNKRNLFLDFFLIVQCKNIGRAQTKNLFSMDTMKKCCLFFPSYTAQKKWSDVNKDFKILFSLTLMGSVLSFCIERKFRTKKDFIFLFMESWLSFCTYRNFCLMTYLSVGTRNLH